MICMIEKEVFMSNSVDPKHHMEVQHDIWLYPLFIRYLLDKDQEDYSGDEIDVWNHYKNGNTAWMPEGSTYFMKVKKFKNFKFFRFLTFSKEYVSDEDIAGKIDTLTTSLEDIKKEVAASRAEMNKKLDQLINKSNATGEA